MAVALLLNTILAYAALAVCRIIFVAVNYNLYAESLQNSSLWLMMQGAFLFDTSAVCYLNIPYILVLLFPFHYKERRICNTVARTLYVTCNGLGIISNLADTVYVPFTGRRTTWSLFSEFSNEENMAQVIGTEILNHWYLVLAGIILIWLLNRLYTTATYNKYNKIRYYILRTALLILSSLLIVTGIRGGIGKAVRPITLSNANRYVSAPNEAAIILNTPFSMIRTIGKKPFKEIKFFEEKELSEIFTPEHLYTPDSTAKKRNVVVFILESFGKEYIGALNPQRETASHTPFLDSLISVSRSYAKSYGNGRKSIDGMPSVLSGIPMFVEPFFVTPASLNRVSGIAGELGKTGYHTAFFHGAPNGSMGFQAFAKTSGFKEYYGMNEYNDSPLHNGNKDFDGTWAIWDEPFFQYYAEKMNEFPQPFVTALFSASSHHPFKIPQEYDGIFKEGKTPLAKCIEYTDNALRLFFETAKKSDWYNNTLFVITADHSNMNSEPQYRTSAGSFEIPIIFFTPYENETFSPGTDSLRIAQQIDIMPTILEHLGYNRAFVSFGKSLISGNPQDSYAVNYLNNIYQYFKNDYMLLFDGIQSTALYNLRNDPVMKKNIIEDTDVWKKMERELKAIIQQYMSRMEHDRLTADEQ